MKPTAANIDKDSVSWTLSWQSDGRCNSFTREAILACAPPASGVYGLFNFDCQVFIGESANIQEALLRHESETDFQSQHLRPTGFAFEPCAAELRKAKADELIARFHPLLQTGAALRETGSPSNDQMATKPDQVDHEIKTHGDHQEFPVHERKEGPKTRRRFQLRRTRAVAWAAMLVAIAVAVFYLGMPADYAIHKRANGANPTSGQTESGLKPPNASSLDTVGSLTNQNAKTIPAKPEVHASASTPNRAVRVAAKSADESIVPAKTSSIAHPSGSSNLSKKWSVQISAAPAKDTADTLIQQLKAKGYDGYVVQAEVKGQTYYRVRVGHFDAREQAESVRQSLANQEGYRDAYLAGD